MKRVLVAAAALAALSTAAAADELNVPYSWTGLYVGVNGGAGYFEGETSDYQGFINGYGPVTISADGVGGFGGGTAGANLQLGQMVVGVEADLQWDSFDVTRSWTAGALVNDASWDWFGTLRARGGVAFDHALVYATGGAAFASVKHGYGQPAAPFPGFFISYDDVEWGFAAGAGIEYALTNHITFKTEYLYVGIPTVTVDDGFGNIYDFKSSAQLARAGLNFKF